MDRETDAGSVTSNKHFIESERKTGSQETDETTAAVRPGGTAVVFWNVLLFPDHDFPFDLNQTLYVHGEPPAGPSTSTAGLLCAPVVPRPLYSLAILV